MKNVFFILLALIFINKGFSQVKWYSIEEALELVKKEPKKIFIDIYTDWCGYCKKMDKETFSNPEIAKILNQHYYAVKFNAETTKPIKFKDKTYVNDGSGRRSPHQLAIQLLQGKMSYPSISYLDEKGNLLTTVPGYYPPQAIEPILNFFAENAYLTIKWEEYQKNFKSSLK